MRSANPLLATWLDEDELRQWAQRVQRRILRDGGPVRGPVWQPPVDMFEDSEGLSIIVALPGVGQRDLELQVGGGALLLSAWRSLPAMPGAAVCRLEIPYGRFERRIPLPSGVYEIRHRSLADGCLRLVLRRIG